MSLRPAFYALGTGGWRDYVTLLHPPYTLWHLSYVAIGAALAPAFDLVRLGLGLGAFALGVGVGAHALDELAGRPLGTSIPDRVLWLAAGLALTGAVAIGIYASFAYTPWLLLLVAAGGFVVTAYNLELFGGRFHGPFWFASSWGALPLLAGYLVTAETLSVEALLAAAFAFLLSRAQQQLSAPVRHVRRRVQRVSGALELTDGERRPVDRATLIEAPESALRTLSAATVTLAAALVALRLT